MGNDTVILPAAMIPSWKTFRAEAYGVSDQVLLTAWGGLGDIVCAIPAVTYALKNFKNVEFSLVCDHPELFSHLQFKEIFSFEEFRSREEEFNTRFMRFDTNVPASHLTWEFMSHALVNAVDFASTCAFRLQLPIADKQPVLVHGFGNEYPPGMLQLPVNWDRCVVVHPGRHWESKTFPVDWWNSVLSDLVARGLQPVIIGKNYDDPTSGNVGTVDVCTQGCVDLRDRTPLRTLIWILQKAKVVITNDSSPLHIAASGLAWIGFIASCKHPDFISHWRKNSFGKPEWSWRMENLGLDGIWDYMDFNPSRSNAKELKVHELPDGLMEKILPEPSTVAAWAEQKISES